MFKLLVLCGPTAIGKTDLAFYLAKKLNGELISADSRQVYKYMDIGTGKDWGDGIVKIWGYDLVRPDEPFSVKNYIDFALPKIEEIQKRGKLPILVGGTGLYIKAVLDGLETLDIPPNYFLRKELEKQSTTELLKILKELNPQKATSLNDSDRKNKRRLIRAIEISNSPKPKITTIKNFDFLMIGLNLKKELLDQKIEQRVNQRLNAGFEKERQFLKRKNFWAGAPSRTIGYKEGDWLTQEKQYAKRQLTWFKKDKRIIWFDVSSSNFKKNIENLAQLWYKNKDATKI
ncbi:MAG: tRNA (adenosine(37)-N6)-dimethylallyltransferase MiaA [Candidatus Woesebacteria bacterium]|nr:MAG: tRNA (adenosine(37)-N6)-dimethylallyltransferase MiaA [Candidatus Woesebacteria bacterium]